MPAPPPMQFAQMPGLMQGSTPTPGDQMKALAKNIGSATKSMFPNLANMQPVAPGAPVPGAVGATAAGGSQGPAPLPGQQALPGSPYSPQAGPPAPPPGNPLVNNQPIGGATSPIPMPQARPPGAPPPPPPPGSTPGTGGQMIWSSGAPPLSSYPGQPAMPTGAPGGPAGGPSGIAGLMQNMTPYQQYAFFQRLAAGGQGGQGGAMPGSAATQNAGMMPSGIPPWASMGGAGG